MYLLDAEAVLKRFDPPGVEEINRWLRENGFEDVKVDPGAPKMVYRQSIESLKLGRYVLASGLWYAVKNFPETGNIEVRSYARLIQSLSVGWDWDFETEARDKEMQAYNIVLSVLGGTPPGPGDIAGIIPTRYLSEAPEEELTNMLLDFLERFYFQDAAAAVMDILEGVDRETAAKIVLSLGRSRNEYYRLQSVTEKFLNKTAPVTDLREEVEKVLN